MKTKRNRNIVEYVKCEYCDAAIDANDPSVTHREAANDIWICPTHDIVRKVSIECIDHPEWGTWGIYEDRGGYYEIHGQRGMRILDKAEAVKFWRIVR